MKLSPPASPVAAKPLFADERFGAWHVETLV
jgi:hypothetical protein